MENLLNNIAMDVLTGFVGSFITVVLATIIWKIRGIKYSGWTVKVVRGEEILCERSIGVRKTMEILDDETTLSVYIKGVCSPFGWLNCDVISETAKDLGVFKVEEKTFVVDMDKNPPKK